MASTTSTITIAVRDVVAHQDAKRTLPLRPPRSMSHERRKSQSSASSDITSLSRPYLHLLMPEPSSDKAHTAEVHKSQVQVFMHILFKRRKNKDWRSLLVFPDDDEDMDEPLTPLRGEAGWSTDDDAAQKDDSENEATHRGS